MLIKARLFPPWEVATVWIPLCWLTPAWHGDMDSHTPLSSLSKAWEFKIPDSSYSGSLSWAANHTWILLWLHDMAAADGWEPPQFPLLPEESSARSQCTRAGVPWHRWQPSDKLNLLMTHSVRRVTPGALVDSPVSEMQWHISTWAGSNLAAG